ncbi:MAG TPA: threonine ammonia-lyase [Pyrinomonadaceae bacterium]|nr:threonine ammonia-lyase [Pyrinomonadaceae bacterium]
MSVKLVDIIEARTNIENIIIPTPILPDARLIREIGTQVFFKAECLQRGGSFKIRGAYNKIHRLTEDEKRRGVIAASAGNHAQGVALAAQLHNINATIVLPEFAPLTKINATKNFGAKVILKGGSFDEAVAYSKQLCEEQNATYVHAFEDDAIIAGQGTIGLEIVEDLPQVTLVVVPIGGGGIISGIALAVKHYLPKVRLIGVQSENCAPLKESLKQGKPIEFVAKPTIADGIAVKRPGEKTLHIIAELVDEIVEVSEEEIARGIFHCVQNNRLVVEGAGAAGVAAILAKKIKVKTGDTVCTVLCGGNIDANLLSRVLEQVLVRQGRYIMLKLLVVDRPGNLAKLLKTTADAGANVIEVYHRRAMWLAPLGYVGIEMLLEVRDQQHGSEVLKYLRENSYHAEQGGVGDWEE